MSAKYNGKTPKYRNQRYNGYDSKLEYNRSLYLKNKEKRGEIHDLEEQVRYELIPSQKDESGRVIERKTSYVADFRYMLPDGTVVVEDTKSTVSVTPEYTIKRKLMLWVHGIRIKEVFRATED